MKYLHISAQHFQHMPELYQLIWPDEDPLIPQHWIMRGDIYLIAETHPNMSFILLRLPQGYVPYWTERVDGKTNAIHTFYQYVD